MDRRTIWAILLMMAIAVTPALFLKKPNASAARGGAAGQRGGGAGKTVRSADPAGEKMVGRAAYSAAANIAEGAAKRGSAEFRRFLDISLDSLSELSYILLLARDLTYLKAEEWGEIEALRDHAGRLTWGLYRSVSGRK